MMRDHFIWNRGLNLIVISKEHVKGLRDHVSNFRAKTRQSRLEKKSQLETRFTMCNGLLAITTVFGDIYEIFPKVSQQLCWS